MQSVSNPLNRLHEEASWFARDHQPRLLVVRTSGDLRKPILKLLPGYEFHADNLSPWVLLDDPFLAADDGWQVRTNRLVESWDLRREAFAKEDVHFSKVEIAVVAQPPRGMSSGLASFLQTCAALLEAMGAPLSGLVLIVAPTAIEDEDALEQDLTTLLAHPELTPCRVVVVLDLDAPLPGDLLETMGDLALTCDCAVDPDQQERDLQAMLSDGGAAAPPLAGMAGPSGVVPPPRVDAPPPLPRQERDEALRMSGVNPELLDEAPQLKALILGAALAMKQRRGPDAVRLQREAAELSHRLGLHQMAVICQISLASYLSGLERRDRAIDELRKATAYAAEHDLPREASQAYLALGLLLALAERYGEAARAYAEAARTAEEAGIVLLAIEGWRLGGQLAAQLGAEGEAASCFREAIRVAEEGDPEVAASSSAPEAARELAEICRRRGLEAQAASLFELANRIEAGELGDIEEDDDPSSRITLIFTGEGREPEDLPTGEGD